MSVKPIHVPPTVETGLQETAAVMGELPLEQVIDAAVWCFGQQPPEHRSTIIMEFWFDGRATPPVEPKATLGGTIRELVHTLFLKFRHRRSQ
jgi:hypothetical protein